MPSNVFCKKIFLLTGEGFDLATKIIGEKLALI
jgi:hypothetical protein